MLQSARREIKRARTGPLVLNTLHDLKIKALEYSQSLLELPPPTSTTVTSGTGVAAAGAVAMKHDSLIHIPMDCAAYHCEGLCLTGPVQVEWIGQLCRRPWRFTLHIDGKYKLHHGGWVLITVGTHYLRWDEHNHTVSNSLAPLVYLMCKQGESGSADQLGSAHMVIDALKSVATIHHKMALKPGSCVSDHASAFYHAFNRGFPEADFLQCWPHIKRNFEQGKYVKKTWSHFSEVKDTSYPLNASNVSCMYPARILHVSRMSLRRR